MENDKLINLKSMARMIGVKPESLQAEADAGRVPFVTVGEERLFPVEGVKQSLYARAQVVAMKLDERTRIFVQVIGELRTANPNVTNDDIDAEFRKRLKKQQGGK